MSKETKEEKKNDQLAAVVPCHSWNADYTQLAISPNNKELLIYSRDKNNTYQLLNRLSGHDSYISGIDWSAATDLIVTCGHDRNAYVWKRSNNTWLPELVILRINRAATTVKWSPDGVKFAVGSGARVMPVCHYESHANWWVSKMIKGIKGTSLSLDWHPNSKIIAVGGIDRKCRVYSAFDSEIDQQDDSYGLSGIFPNQFEFGELLCEVEASGWVESLAWSPAGYRLAFSSHDSSITFVQLLSGSQPPYEFQIVKMKNLPFRALAYLSDDCVVAAGNDCSPYLFVASGSEAEPKWEFAVTADNVKGTAAGSKSPRGETKDKGSNFDNVRTRWVGVTAKGGNIQKAELTKLNTRHQNLITCIRKISGTEADKVTKFTTSGLDGFLLHWDLKALGANLKQLKLV